MYLHRHRPTKRRKCGMELMPYVRNLANQKFFADGTGRVLRPHMEILAPAKRATIWRILIALKMAQAESQPVGGARVWGDRKGSRAVRNDSQLPKG